MIWIFIWQNAYFDTIKEIKINRILPAYLVCIIKCRQLASTGSTRLSSFFSFTLSACSRVGRVSLMLRDSAPHFPPSSGGIAWLVAELNISLCLDTGTNKSKYFIFLFPGGESNSPHSPIEPITFTFTLLLHSHSCAPKPRLA